MIGIVRPASPSGSLALFEEPVDEPVDGGGGELEVVPGDVLGPGEAAPGLVDGLGEAPPSKPEMKLTTESNVEPDSGTTWPRPFATKTVGLENSATAAFVSVFVMMVSAVPIQKTVGVAMGAAAVTLPIRPVWVVVRYPQNVTANLNAAALCER